MKSRELKHGILENVAQFAHQLIQVLLVGFALGMMRTVVPAMAETEFGVRRGSFLLLTAFVVAFGVVKAAMNFLAGRMSEKVGRKRVLFWGWMVALPIPLSVSLSLVLSLHISHKQWDPGSVCSCSALPLSLWPWRSQSCG